MLQFDEQSDESKIDLDVGQIFRVTLRENPTTGFRWNPISRGEPVCRLLDNSFDLDHDTLGNRGRHSWQFRAVKEGSGKIEFAYSRPWEQGKSPALTFSLYITVRE